MLQFVARPAVKFIERYLPDPYVFVLLLTVIAAAAAITIDRQSPIAVLGFWGNGFWGLLDFAMRLLLLLITSQMLASSPPAKRLLDRLASVPAHAGNAIVMVTLVSLVASWVNWALGLVIGALFAKALARQILVDYRLLIASAYSGFIIWHGGLSGSIPLTIATPGHFAETQIGLFPVTDTLFTFYNIAIVVAIFLCLPMANRLMLPSEQESVYHDDALLIDVPEPDERNRRPADRLENSPWLSYLIGIPGVLYAALEVIGSRGLDLNNMILLFLSLSLLLHRTPRRALASLHEAIKGGAGIIIQLPFYAGIMGIIAHSGLAETLTETFIAFADVDSLPFWTFISAGIINIFIPFGEGQWAIQAPVMVSAAEALGGDMPRIAMAVAWGDAWSNLLQPFWALPLLAISGLKAKDIMGFCLIQLFITGAIIGTGLTWL